MHTKQFKETEARFFAAGTDGERRHLWKGAEDEAVTPMGRFRPTGFAKLDAIVATSGAAERFSYGGNRAETNRAKGGTIQMPWPESFESPRAYARTLAHELIHWTGSEDVLNRPMGISDFVRAMAGMPPIGYPREELTAELGAALLLDAAGIEQDLDYSRGYFESWTEPFDYDEEQGNVDEAKAWAQVKAEEAVEYLLQRAGF